MSDWLKQPRCLTAGSLVPVSAYWALEGEKRGVEPALAEPKENAPWREAAIHLDSCLHRYLLLRWDGHRALKEAARDRTKAGKDPVSRFYPTTLTYILVAGFKSRFMNHHDDIDPNRDHTGYVLNRAGVYRDRRDWVVQ